MQVWIYVIPYLSYSKITARIRFCHEKKYLKNHIVFFFNRFNYFRVLDTGISVLKLWHLWGDSKNHFKSEKFTVASHRQYDPKNTWGAKKFRKVVIMRRPTPHLQTSRAHANNILNYWLEKNAILHRNHCLKKGRLTI